jgi:hypothetical protein
MISTILGQVTGQLEKRFVLNALFPSLVFVLALGATIAAGFNGPVASIEAWEGDSTGARVLITIAAVGGVFLFANLLNNGMQGVVALFEGYRLPEVIAAPARRHQLGRASEQLAKAKEGTDPEHQEAADLFQLTFPVYPETLAAGDVAPTRLGNVLRSAESYPRQRYGVDSVRIWPRLSPLLGDPIVSTMASARASMEFFLAVSLLSGIYAPLGSIYLIVNDATLVWIGIALFGGSLMSFVSCRAALAPAAIYGEQIRTAFDLYRHKLLLSVGAPMPVTLEEERRLWSDLLHFLERGEPIETWRYVVPADGS